MNKRGPLKLGLYQGASKRRDMAHTLMTIHFRSDFWDEIPKECKKGLAST